MSRYGDATEPRRAVRSTARYRASPISRSCAAASSAPTEVNSESVPLLNITDPKTKNTKKYSRHMERFPPNDGFHYDMPRLNHLARNTLYAINWSWNHVYATVGMLDLWNRNLMG